MPTPSPMKLFIPGPTEVAPEILQEMARPAIGHRTEECARLWRECRAGLRTLTRHDGEVVMLTAPASAMMEAAIRNCVPRRSLHHNARRPSLHPRASQHARASQHHHRASRNFAPHQLIPYNHAKFPHRHQRNVCQTCKANSG